MEKRCFDDANNLLSTRLLFRFLLQFIVFTDCIYPMKIRRKLSIKKIKGVTPLNTYTMMRPTYRNERNDSRYSIPMDHDLGSRERAKLIVVIFGSSAPLRFFTELLATPRFYYKYLAAVAILSSNARRCKSATLLSSLSKLIVVKLQIDLIRCLFPWEVTARLSPPRDISSGCLWPFSDKGKKGKKNSNRRNTLAVIAPLFSECQSYRNLY